MEEFIRASVAHFENLLREQLKRQETMEKGAAKRDYSKAEHITIGIIGWEVFDIVKGKASTLTWIVLGFFSLVGIFELGAIFSAKKKKDNPDETKPVTQAA